MIIAVECYPDEKLVRSLIPEVGDALRHMGGKGNIINRLRKKTIVKAVGLIDEDPESAHPRDFNQNYIEIDSLGTVKLFGHRDKTECTVIMLCPRIEEWFLSRAKAAGIDPSEYNLPADGEKLHAISHYERSDDFSRFLDNLSASGDAEVEKVRQWLQ